MEKFFLGAVLSYYKLYVVYHQYVYGPVFFAELGHGSCITAADGFDDLVGKFFAGDIEYLFFRILL